MQLAPCLPACLPCRPAGGDPATSVLDPTGECWEVAGLYCMDGSTFPTPTGVNPMIRWVGSGSALKGGEGRAFARHRDVRARNNSMGAIMTPFMPAAQGVASLCPTIPCSIESISWMLSKQLAARGGSGESARSSPAVPKL